MAMSLSASSRSTGTPTPTATASTLTYADRDLPGPPAIPGKIVGPGQPGRSGGHRTGQRKFCPIELTLDDTDGSIKSLYDQYDFHKQDVRVYQWFNGLDYG